MNRILRMACVAVAGVLLLLACVKESTSSYTQQEGKALQEWMEINHPELVGNLQSDGGYYVDVLDLGDTQTKPVSDTVCWVRFSMTGRNLAGDIILTRDEVIANQAGSYTKFTYYAPYYLYYGGDSNPMLLEGTYLAMRDKLLLDETYASSKGFPREVQMRIGTKVTLYMPSTIVGTGGMSGSGGYEGQKGYELKSGSPFVVTMQITGIVENPLKNEGRIVDDFAANNGKLEPKIPRPTSVVAHVSPADDGFDPLDPFAWRYADYEVPQVYINRKYLPTKTFTYPSIYASVYEPYNNFAKLEKDICDTLVNRFGTYDDYRKLPVDTIGLNNTAKIWYIARLLDGFIVDSNIPGVRALVFGKASAKGSVLSYNPSAGGMIQAFYYAIPRFRYGQWGAILTSSTNAYGASGQAGKTSTSNNADYTGYYNSMNNSAGMGGMYGNYYSDYYSNYMGGYYNPNYGNITGMVESTTSIETEIQPFTPLLFQIYIEPKVE